MDTTGIDLLNLISTKLKKVSGTNGGEWRGACPFCGGTDRFRVQPHNSGGGRWFCRQCSPRGGDAISFVEKHDGIDFKAAIAKLGLLSDAPVARRQHRENDQRTSAKIVPEDKPRPGVLKSDYISLNDPGYQRKADSFVTESILRLYSEQCRGALDYLLGRGLSLATIGAAELGYNPTDRHETWGAADVYLPAGIVIPWQLEGQYWRVNFRRMGTVEKGKRYISAAGFANALYNADDIGFGSTVVMTEGEFDALAVRTGAASLLPHGLVAVATGTASGSRLLRWVARLFLADRVLLAFDMDKAGEDAAAWWSAQLGTRAIRVTPTAHDVNDMLKAGCNLTEWILDAVPANATLAKAVQIQAGHPLAQVEDAP